VTKRAFASQLAVTTASLGAFGLAEAVVCGVRGGLADVVACLGLWAFPLALSALLSAWLLAALCDDGALLLWLAELWTKPPARAALILAGAGASLLGAAVFWGAQAIARYHNRELAAALLASAAVALSALLGLIGFVLWRRPPRGLLAGALLVGVTVWSWMLWQSRGGIAQLDPRLLAPPLAAAALFVVADRSERLRVHARSAWGAVFGVLFACWAWFLLAPLATSASLASRGAWSGALVRALAAGSDLDGDGYSSWFGGGDCAPLDAAIHPRAIEVAGDGIDNNCIGGDGGKSSAPQRPIWGSSAHGSPSNLNIVVVTIETLRHDHASFIGARHDTTPNLRGLASSSLVFERMYSAAPYTRLALASLFSSYAPSEIDWQLLEPDKHMRHIAPSTPWLPELLSARGYETIAVLTDFSAFTSRESIGFERGFRHYDTTTSLEYRGGTMRGFPAAQQVDKALDYVKRASRPFMLWLHLFEPHYRYEQPPGAPLFGGDEQSRYDAEIWHVDHELGRLFGVLRELGVWDSTVLFVSGDHGEAFGEHDDRWHGTNVYDPQLRPAALLRVPGISGKRVDASVAFTDVAPTLARIIGDRQSFDQLRGRSLAPLMHHRALPESQRGFVAETFNIEDGRAYQAALVAGSLKLIYTEQGQRFELFDLAADPRESRPIAVDSDPRAIPLLSELIGYLERTRPRTFSAAK
jgi:arylsulfatase A-like enzyme